MLIVGCSLAQMRFKQIFGSWRIYALSALKLAAVPLLAYAVLRHVLTNEFALCVLTVLLCMPIATNTTILSYQYGADETAASSGVFVSTLLSLLTIPLMMKLLFGTSAQSLTLPRQGEAASLSGLIRAGILCFDRK